MPETPDTPFAVIDRDLLDDNIVRIPAGAIGVSARPLYTRAMSRRLQDVVDGPAEELQRSIAINDPDLRLLVYEDDIDLLLGRRGRCDERTRGIIDRLAESDALHRARRRGRCRPTGAEDRSRGGPSRSISCPNEIAAGSAKTVIRSASL